MKKKGTPKIYFSRNIVLIETTFGEIIFSLRSGLSRMLSSDDIGLPVVRANNISHGNLDLNNDVKYWYQEDPQGANTNNYLIKKNDLLINFINSEKKMGTAALVKEEPKRATIYTTNILNLRTKSGIDPYYIFMITKTLKYKNYIKSITKPAVNQASFTTVDFKKFSLKLPSFEEQQKIGYFFKNLDDTISLHQQELEALKQTKQGFLQKLFPREAEVVPEIRFNDFKEDWETKKISKIATETFGGGTPKTAEKRFWSGDIPWIQSSDITQHKVYEVFPKKTISEEAVKSSATKLIPKDSIAVVTRVGVGKVALIEYDYSTSQDFVSLSNLKSDKWFTIYALYKILQRELHNVQGTSIKGITKSELLEKNIMLPPNIEEQVKIGEFFRQLDEVIELKEKEVEALKETKKGFLQKMFV